MTLIDTSALYALADRRDPNHEAARRIRDSLRRRERTVLTHSYILVEATALFGRRLGRQAVAALVAEMDSLEILWVDERLHRAALEAHLRGRLRISFVDQVSFLVMRARGIGEAFAFDRDFVDAGFRLAPDPA